MGKLGVGNKAGKRGQGPPDPNVHAFNIVQQAIGEVQKDEIPEKPEKSPAAATHGRLGGLKGGAARALKLTPEQRPRSLRKRLGSVGDRRVKRPSLKPDRIPSGVSYDGNGVDGFGVARGVPMLALAMAEKPRGESDPHGRAERREREWYG
jgi:hypothetical protein